MKQHTFIKSLILASTVVFGLYAFGQDAVYQVQNEGTQSGRVRVSQEKALTEQAMENMAGLAGKVVKGQPYSAEATTTTEQTLGDGTHIHRSNSYTIYRDSEGRTRRETPNEIWISDPVANESYILIPSKMIARKMPLMRTMVSPRLALQPPAGVLSAQAGGGGAVVASSGPAAEKLLERQKLSESELHAATAAGWYIGGGDGEKGMVTYFVNQSTAGLIEVRGGAMTRGGITGENSQEQNEDLGARPFEGVQAQGVRHLVTVPPGQIGNDRPIQYVTERWFSPELQVTIMTKNSDPINGETVFQLTNIRRGQQSESLFQVPGSYQIAQEPGRGEFKRQMD